MIVILWILSFLVSIAPMFGWKDPEWDKRLENYECLVSQDVGYQIFATASSFYVPLLAILFLYWRIFLVARKRIRRRQQVNILPTFLFAISQASFYVHFFYYPKYIYFSFWGAILIRTLIIITKIMIMIIRKEYLSSIFYIFFLFNCSVWKPLLVVVLMPVHCLELPVFVSFLLSKKIPSKIFFLAFN
jgi:hypothetical protein